MTKNYKDKEYLRDEDASTEYVDGEKLPSLNEQKEAQEKKELTKERASNQQLRQEIESMDLDDGLKKQAANSASTIKSLDDPKKIKKLLELARLKGITYAVHVAKQMNDPYILDTFHDVLAKEGYYKKFSK